MGHQACLGHGGGHTTWTCRTCDYTVYGPPLNTHCTTLARPSDRAHLDQADGHPLTARRGCTEDRSPAPKPAPAVCRCGVSSI